MTNVTITPQASTAPGAPTPAPPVRQVHFSGGVTPTHAESRRQIEAQKALNSVVTDRASLHTASAPEKKAPEAKAEATAKEPEEAREGTSNTEDGTQAKPETDERLKRLNKLEAAAREKDKELKAARAKIAELEPAGVTAKEYAEFVKNAKRDPIKALEKLGLTVQQIADAVISGKVPGPEDEKLEELEKKVTEFEAQQTKLREEAEQAQRQAAVVAGTNQLLSNVGKFIEEASAQDETAYELLTAKVSQPAKDPAYRNAASEDIMELVNAYHAEHGEIPSPDKIATALEAFYEQQAEESYKQFSSSKKLAAKLGLGAKAAAKEAPAKPSAPVAKKPEAPTLGGRKTAAVPQPMPLEGRKFKNDKERLEAVVAWGRSQLGQTGAKQVTNDPRKR